MNQFSIQQLQQFSGIKAHTIRMWEQRYKALKPYRTEGNTRYYDNTQLKRLLNITSLMHTNKKVSELCIMSDDSLASLIKAELEVVAKTFSYDQYISQVISALLDYDETKTNSILSKCIKRFGIKKTYKEVIYPMYVKIGLMWLSNDVMLSQEHFISNIMRKKLFSWIENLPKTESNASQWVLFLPEDEFHEVGLLMANYLLQEMKQKVIYLGANVPIKEVVNTVNVSDSSHVLFFLVHHDKVESTQKLVDELYLALPDTNISIAGNTQLIGLIKLYTNMAWIQSVDELEQLIINNTSKILENV